MSNSSRKVNILCAIIAVIIGLLAGVIDFNNNEPQPAAIILVASAGLLGLWRPDVAWLWGALCGLGIPIVYLVGRAFGFVPINWPEPGWYATFLAIVPAMIGAFWGYLMRKLFSSVRRNNPDNQPK
jgi:hypothetical protein